MNAKDTIIGTTKQIVAEIVGDGALAEEGTLQVRDSAVANDSASESLAPQERPTPATAFQSEFPPMNEERFASLLGLAALKIWPDLPRDVQEQLFAAAVDDGVVATSLAEFLHDRHPRTGHPPKLTRLA